MRLLGAYCMLGYGCPVDPDQARAWIERAHQAGDIPATRGAKWLRAAAEQNDAHAQFSLGICYMNGQGVPVDRDFGVHCWRKTASVGHSGATAALQQIGAA